MSSYPESSQPGKTNTMAIISLITGILSVIVLLLSFCIPCGGFISLILGIAGAVTGFLARKRIDESAGAETGRGMAIAGLITGLTSIAVSIILLIIGAISTAALFSLPEILQFFNM